MRDRELAITMNHMIFAVRRKTNDRKQRFCKWEKQEIKHPRRNSKPRAKRVHEFEVRCKERSKPDGGDASPNVHESTTNSWDLSFRNEQRRRSTVCRAPRSQKAERISSSRITCVRAGSRGPTRIAQVGSESPWIKRN